MSYKTRIAILAIIATMAVYSCGKDPASSYEPDVVNTLDNFHFRIEDVSNHDTLLTYYWRLSGTSANINQLSSIAGGRASLVIVDQDSTSMYETDFSLNGDFQSQSGRTGLWKITLRLSSFSGMIEFRVQGR